MGQQHDFYLVQSGNLVPRAALWRGFLVCFQQPSLLRSANLDSSEFTYATTNSDGVRRGNRWKYDFAYLHRLLPRKELGAPALYAVLEMNGEHVRRTRRNGIPIADSGGNLVFFSPGVEFIPNRRFVIEFSLPIPIGRDLNGNQMNPSVSFLAGIRWLF